MMNVDFRLFRRFGDFIIDLKRMNASSHSCREVEHDEEMHCLHVSISFVLSHSRSPVHASEEGRKV